MTVMTSLRYYLFSRFVGVIFCQVLIGIFVGRSYIKGEMLQQYIDHSFDDLNFLSKNISFFYYDQLEEVSRLANRSDFGISNKKDSQKLLKNYIEARGLISSVHFYSRGGKLEFSVKSDRALNYRAEDNYYKNADPNFSKYADQVFRDKKMMLTHPLYTRTKVFFHAGIIPVFSKKTKEVVAVVSVAFFPNLNPLNRALTGLNLNGKNILILTDKDANLIAGNGVDSTKVKEALAHFVKHRGKTQNNPFQYKRKNIEELTYSVGEDQFYFVSFKVKDTPFISILGLNKSIIDNYLKQLEKKLIIILSLCTLLGLVFSIFFTRKISMQMNVLVDAVKSLKLGTFKLISRPQMHKDFSSALDEIEDLSIEIEKGRLLGNLWGQKSSFMDRGNE